MADKWLIATLSVALLAQFSRASAEPVSGQVVDSALDGPVAGAVVIDKASGIEVATDEFGRFAFDNLAPGLRELRIRALGYVDSLETINVKNTDGAQDLSFYVMQAAVAGEVIEISGSRKRVPSAQGKQELAREEISVLPGTRGDALQSLKSLPGVGAVEAGGGPGPGLVIRGSSPEDSKGNIDGIEVPILYHFFGFQSVLPTEFIDGIEYLPGGFGVEEGRATGGVINVTTRPGRAAETSGHAEVSFINAAAFLQGPIGDSGRIHYAVGLRRSLIDAILPLVIPDDSTLTFTTAPRYYDAQARLDWTPTDRDRFTVLALLSNDLLTLINEDQFDPNEPLATGKFDNETGFNRLMASWTRDGDKLDGRSIVSIGQDHIRVEIGSERYLRLDALRLENRTDWTFAPVDLINLRGGTDLRLQTGEVDSLFPVLPAEGSGMLANFSVLEPVRTNETTTNNMIGGYAAIDLHPTDTTTFTSGLRLDHFARYDSTTLSPRASVSQQLHERVTAKVAIGDYSRPLLGPEALATHLEAERATQYVAGAETSLAEGITTTLSGFYTDLRNLVTQDPVVTQVDPVRAYVNTGTGRTFGLEALLRIRRDNFFGWAAYTLAKSDRIDGPGESRRLFDFDQTHNLVVLGSYELNRWRFGGRWQMTTGAPSTPVVGSIYQSDQNLYLPILGTINGERLPTAHQLDVRVDRQFVFDTWDLALYLDVTNVYAHPRVLAYQYNFDFSERGEITDLPIVPALGVRGSF